MTIWVDADACPRSIRDILFRAAERRGVALVLVANQGLSPPPSKYISAVRVGAGFDVADNYIADHAGPGDLVVTADIPLAADALKAGAEALNPRGERYDNDNIGERLGMRDMMAELRSTRQISGGPPPLGKRDVQQFANQLDRWLAQQS